jgi:hypothetical protein
MSAGYGNLFSKGTQLCCLPRTNLYLIGCTDVRSYRFVSLQSNNDTGDSFMYCGMGGCRKGVHVRFFAAFLRLATVCSARLCTASMIYFVRRIAKPSLPPSLTICSCSLQRGRAVGEPALTLSLCPPSVIKLSDLSTQRSTYD